MSNQRLGGLTSHTNRQLLLGILVVLAAGGLMMGAALTVGADEAESSQGEVEVTLEHSQGLDLVPGISGDDIADVTQTYELNVYGAEEGLEAYEATVELESNDADAEIVDVTAFTEEGEDTYSFVNVTADDDSIYIEAALGNETFDPVGADEAITIAEVEMNVDFDENDPMEERVERPGWDVAFSGVEMVALVDDDETFEENLYDVNAPTVSHEAVFIDVDENGVPAQDATGDGLLEDTEADNRISIFDSINVLDLRGDAEIEDDYEVAHFFNWDGADPDRVTIFDAIDHLDLRGTIEG